MECLSELLQWWGLVYSGGREIGVYASSDLYSTGTIPVRCTTLVFFSSHFKSPTECTKCLLLFLDVLDFVVL